MVELFDEVMLLTEPTATSPYYSSIKRRLKAFKGSPRDFSKNLVSLMREMGSPDRKTQFALFQKASSWYYQKDRTPSPGKKLPPVQTKLLSEDFSNISEKSQESDRSSRRCKVAKKSPKRHSNMRASLVKKVYLPSLIKNPRKSEPFNNRHRN